MSTYEQILWETRDRVGLITLDRPEKLNAWTRTMQLELIDVIERANANPEIGAIVVTGAGRGFCAGADISEQFKARLDGDPAPDRRPSRDWVELVRESKPMIAAINGVAVGVGMTMTLPFDVLVASTEARVGMFFVRMGLVPELASSHLLVQRVGFGLASEMCLTGALYGASELEHSGLFNRVVSPEHLLATALDIGGRIAANPDSTARVIKSLLTRNGSETDLAAVQQRELEALAAAQKTPEHREAVQAFLEKRNPDFRSVARAPAE